MKTKLMALLMAAIAFAGCGKMESRTNTSLRQLGDAIKESRVAFSEALTNTARAYFNAGVTSAKASHQEWVHSHLTNGVLPSVVGMEPKTWDEQSHKVWLKQMPDDPYIKP